MQAAKDRAIEFGEYLAKSAEGYMDAINKYSAGEVDSDYLTDHWRGLQNAIGEFRKRAKRVSEHTCYRCSRPITSPTGKLENDYCQCC